MEKIISIDIGSTFTKGALFERQATMLRPVQRACVPTTTAHLAEGFQKCIGMLTGSNEIPDNCRLVYSSSAKGGLGIVAIGAVPELTLKMAKDAACSAGGKIQSVFAYKLTPEDIEAINSLRPDIILFTGGTDGGNETIVRHNLQMLENIAANIPVIFAANRSLRSAAEKLLAKHQLHIIENVLPELNSPNPEPAQEKIRELFLKQIVTGKGLDELVKSTGQTPVPTPYSMLEFVKVIADCEESPSEFCIIDMGGATTDFYSRTRRELDSDCVITRGLPEPNIKRTVEGDVGMRICADAAIESDSRFIDCKLEDYSLSRKQLNSYLKNFKNEPSYLPQNDNESRLEELLAAVCLRTAAVRHCGRRRTVYTITGPTAVQTGKNLRRVSTIIGTGGFLAQADDNILKNTFAGAVSANPEEEILLPEQPKFFADKEYLLPLLANTARIAPDAAAATALNKLTLRE
ncbi:glutamate mutase L [Lentisphaerota bacterium ZTH]|nr:glutamate mutase L [Lentisphaerota bacterium]WET05096.1 glutamate mutase L [Lentisphaerota bacterium ZTH]